MDALHHTDRVPIKADLYRLLANCFDFPASEKLGTISELSQALCEAGYPDSEIQNLIATLNSSMVESEILHDYSRIFIKGGVPLSESHTLKKFNSISDVNGFYAAFGFSPKSGENPDSIMHELEFLALLCLKISIAPGLQEKEITGKAYEDFLTDHAAEFALALADKIREGDAGRYFITVANLLTAFIKAETEIIKSVNL